MAPWAAALVLAGILLTAAVLKKKDGKGDLQNGKEKV